MKKLRFYLYWAVGAAGLLLLFLFNFCYLFAALGLLTFGLTAFPVSLLGAAGVIRVTTDLPFPALTLLGGGILLLGFGLCLGTAAVCPASMECLRRFRLGLERRERDARR